MQEFVLEFLFYAVSNGHCVGCTWWMANPKQGLNLFPQSKFNNLLCTQIGSILICESFGLSFHGINDTLLNYTRIYVHQG
jgi:hypothetical protein